MVITLGYGQRQHLEHLLTQHQITFQPSSTSKVHQVQHQLRPELPARLAQLVMVRSAGLRKTSYPPRLLKMQLVSSPSLPPLAPQHFQVLQELSPLTAAQPLIIRSQFLGRTLSELHLMDQFIQHLLRNLQRPKRLLQNGTHIYWINVQLSSLKKDMFNYLEISIKKQRNKQQKSSNQ